MRTSDLLPGAIGCTPAWQTHSGLWRWNYRPGLQAEGLKGFVSWYRSAGAYQTPIALKLETGFISL